MNKKVICTLMVGALLVGIDIRRRSIHMLKSLGEDLKKIMLAGIGAVAITSEKSAELIDDLVKKGQVTVEQGKELNEELKRNLKTKVQDAVNEHVNVTVVTNEEENILDKLDTLSEEELQAVKEKLDKIEREKNNNVSTEESVSEIKNYHNNY